MIRTTLPFFVALALLFAGWTATAQTTLDEGVISRTTMEVSNEVMSPFCPGKTLAMCPSPAAAEVRRDIQKMAREGSDTETIKQALIDKYGDEFKRVEPSQSDNALVLALVGAGLLLCLFVVLWISKRGTGRDEDDASGRGDDDGDDDSGSGTGSGSGGGEDGDPDNPYLDALRDEYTN